MAEAMSEVGSKRGSVLRGQGLDERGQRFMPQGGLEPIAYILGGCSQPWLNI